MRSSLSSLAPIVLLALTAALLLGPTLWGDQALLPGAQLQGMAPWSGAAPERAANPPWNPLVWDAVAQFYPWRLFGARWIARGSIPLWDPHQFCGTPFLANSQSALLYPLNWLIFLPLGLSVTRAMVLVAWLQLTLAGSFTFLWLRGLGAGRPASFTAGAAFMLSGFLITWLELPTFLSVACWLPLLFRAVHRLVGRPTPGAALAAGALVGLVLLGGHLQIAFYSLLGAGLYSLGELLRVAWEARAARGASDHGGTEDTEENARGTEGVPRLSGQTPPSGTAAQARHSPVFLDLSGLTKTLGIRLLLAVLALALGAMLAAPQLLPAIELSRASHRVGTPTAAGFAAYVAYAMPMGHLLTLFLPDFYGNPTRGDYWGAGNYAEYAGYVGVVSLFLAFASLGQVRRQPQVLLLGLLAVFSLAMATGSPLNALFYFGVPGFGQSGSPGRILVLFCFAAASLAGLGLDGLVGEGRQAGGRAPWVIPLVATALWGAAFAAARGAAEAFVARTPVLFSQAWSRSETAWQSALALVGVAAALLVAAGLLTRFRPPAASAPWLTAVRLALPALVVADGWLFASGYNPTAPASWIYPPTAATRVLAARQSADPGARILPVNRRWSLSSHPRAVLPPNAALALELTDAQGYDSLFLGRYKGLANAIQAPGDSSPVQNGNMVFLWHLESPLLPLLGARSIITTEPLPGRRALYAGEGVWVYDDPTSLPRVLVTHTAETSATEEGELEALQRLAERGSEALRGTIVLPAGASGMRDLTLRPSAQSGNRSVLHHPGAQIGAPAAVNLSPQPPPRNGEGETGSPLRTFGTGAVSEGGRRSREQAPLPASGRGRGRGPDRPTPSDDAAWTPASPNASEVHVRLARDGWVLVTESFAPGWHAYLAEGDGGEREVPLLRGDFAFRAVTLPAGEHRVRFRYEPATFRVGLFLAGLGLMLLAGWGGIMIARRRFS